MRGWPVALIAAVLTVSAANGFAQGKPAAEFGRRAAEDAKAAVWWAEGAYKVMKDTPVPKAAGGTARLACARNEFEPFLVVLRPKVRLDNVRAEASALRSGGGAEIPASAIEILRVEYVRVHTPTDPSGAEGWWPDPLPPLEAPFTALADENCALWITVRAARDAAPGLYKGAIRLSADGWRADVPVELTVRAFALPDRPTLRSSFGLPSDPIRLYHNLETRAELEAVMDLYYRNLAAHRVAPTSPFELYPMKVSFRGVFWDGGELVTDAVHGGARALRVDDQDVGRAVEGRSTELVTIEPGLPYRLSWFARTGAEGQDYTVLLECADAEGRVRPAWNVLSVFKGAADWKPESLPVKAFPEGARSVRLRLFPVFRDSAGTKTGTAWFDDIVFAREPAGPASPGAGEAPANLLPGGDFEMPAERMAVVVDFTDFDRGGRKLLDGLGFNAFDLPLQGLGTGSFYSSQEGMFAGFRQGTPEYDRLMSAYLGLVEAHLQERGWLGREYIYWFDEPDPKDYPFVRRGMENIRKAAPRLTRFITEHRPGPEIMDVSEIGCTIFDRVDPKIVADLAPRGREFWSYLCTGPKAPWVTLFIDHPAINLRIWPWMSHRWGLKGILVWRANYWTSDTVFPPGEPQNPWDDPMSYTVGYGVPYGRVDRWGNGDGRFLYPPNRTAGRDRRKDLRGPVNSVRWEILREGIEDYEYFVLLEKAAAAAGPEKAAAAVEARKILEFPAAIFASGKDYAKDPQDLLKIRARIAELIETLAR